MLRAWKNHVLTGISVPASEFVFRERKEPNERIAIIIKKIQVLSKLVSSGVLLFSIEGFRLLYLRLFYLESDGQANIDALR